MRPTTKAGGTVKDVDTDSRTVVAHYSVFGVVDEDGDVVHSGAFKQSIEKDGPEGRDRIWKMRDHDWAQRLGKPDAIYEDGDGLVMETTMPDTTLANDVLAMYEQVGESMEHSVGMMLPEDGTERRKEDEPGMDIFQAKLVEGSVVPWGSNMHARMQEMKSDAELAASEVIPRQLDTLKDLLSAEITDTRKEMIDLHLREMEKAWDALQGVKREKEDAEEQSSPTNERALEIAQKAEERLQTTKTVDRLSDSLSTITI